MKKIISWIKQFLRVETPKQQKWVNYFWIGISLPFISLFLILLFISFGWLGFMPTFEQLENPKSDLASEIIASDGIVLGKYFKENRTIVNFEELPQNLVNALIATEDARFYDHSGIDFMALGRVFFGVITGNSKGGGSTVTQQLAKNLFPRNINDSESGIVTKLSIAVTKFKEWITAIKLERNYTKQEILVMYLNTVPFGSQAFGIKSAAKTFFNKKPEEMTIEECATIIGLLKAPSYYSPVYQNKRSTLRRNTVLGQMAKYEFITKAKCDSLKKTPLTIDYHPSTHNRGLATYFREFLRTTLNANKPESSQYPSWQQDKYEEDALAWEHDSLYGWCNKVVKADGTPYNLYEDGLKIYVAINSKMQEYAEEALTEHMSTDLQPSFSKEKKNTRKGPFAWDMTDKQIQDIYNTSMRRSERYVLAKKNGVDEDDIIKQFSIKTHMKLFSWQGDIDTTLTPMDSIKYYKYLLNAGFMAMDPQSGLVRAYVGGIDYQYFQYDHVTQARRQVGSTFKPFLYTLAMMEFPPCYKVPNVEVSFELPEGQEPATYTPKYSPNKREGEMISFKYGLASSLNQISAWIMKKYGPEATIMIARKMGVKSPLEPVPSLCVGAAEVTLAEMVGAYSTFASNGLYTEPIYVVKIEDKYGNELYRAKPRREQAINQQTAYRMLDLMQGVVNSGTSVRLRYKYKFTGEIAGKTGTTNNNSDGWFIGMVPKLVAGGWVGGEERSIHFSSTVYGQGAALALPIYALFMKKVYNDKSLGINQEDKFERPVNMPLDNNCDEKPDGGDPNNLFITTPEEELFN